MAVATAIAPRAAATQALDAAAKAAPNNPAIIATLMVGAQTAVPSATPKDPDTKAPPLPPTCKAAAQTIASGCDDVGPM